MPKKTSSYQELSEQLEAVLAKLQSSDVQLDDAMQLYEQGLKLVTALEMQLKDAENTITRLQLQAKQAD
ncbi:MAG TPA: exodeoxyribonuclease VII small subunit [Candidatus Saccharimonadales bacterium]|nr:exodeoxyribonuclease VII small subunit [Candidatus Saccharimonadales bacterium]